MTRSNVWGAVRLEQWSLLGALGVAVVAWGQPAFERDAIVSGTQTTADPEVFKLLQPSDGGAFCTATRISSRTLLTAGHCLATLSSVDNLRVSNAPTSELVAAANTFSVASSALHPQFDHDAGLPIFLPDGGVGVVETANDVALILLNQAPPGSFKKLNRRALTSTDLGQTVRMYGFGRTVPNVDVVGDKYMVELPIDEISDTLFWVGTKQYEGKGTCSGDSGGPAFLVAADGQETIAGIIRGTHPAFPVCSYDMMTRVDKYAADFIDPWLEANDPVPSGQGCGCSTGPGPGWLVAMGLLRLRRKLGSRARAPMRP